MSNVKVFQHEEKGNTFQPQKKSELGAWGRGKKVEYNFYIKKLFHT